MDTLHIYSAEVCPFAARTRLALLEKGLPFEVTEIDLRNKPAWFPQVSPYGKVPVLKHGATLVWESSIINEYVEETFPERPLMPKAPTERARARFWIDFANVKFTPTWYRVFLAQKGEERERQGAELMAHFRFMEEEGIAKGPGPFWMGAQLTLVDLCYQPWFERIPALTHYRGLGLPGECRRLADWSAMMAARPSVKSIAKPIAYYLEGYRRYADGTEDGVTARELKG
jgi:glutathione S-transferase